MTATPGCHHISFQSPHLNNSHGLSLPNRLASNVPAWIACLSEMKESRKSFDTQETQRTFGAVSVDYTKVQSKVQLKYDAWHRDVLGKFGQLLGGELQEFHAQVAKARGDLEGQSVEAASTSEAVGVITYVQALKRRLKDWERRVEAYTAAQKILERQRWVFCFVGLGQVICHMV